ncbi:unnamed protein product [Adineta steineri]|uniref:G-protein coupled receptors family 1 profile domain-containing protein n=1 Tax=Adineta steineri TaxID=433720 RepID=A0A814K9L5_9BILA|nr:unnamed protein product [Adineta steineri]
MNTSMIEFEINATCTDVLQQSRYYSLTLYLPNTEYLFIFLFQLIIGCTIVNNILTIQTCLCRSIRITNLGVYLIFLSLSNLIRCIFLETSIISDTQSLQRTILFYISAILLNLLNFLAMWYSSMIACERLFIECFNCALYATRKRACYLSFIILIFTFLTQIPTFLLYFGNFDISTIFPNLVKSVKCIEFGTVLITCLIHILSSLFVLRNISVHKVYINSGEEKYWVVWRQQMKKHMDFFIPPLCYILCIVFPNLVKSVKCIEFGTVLITCLIHILSSLFVLRNISVHKVYINSGEEKYWVVWRQQMKKHMNFFIPPLCYILCIVPWYLFKHVIYSCDRIGPAMTLRLYLILITLANIPFTMTFAIYIYPSNVYINEFKRSLIVLMTKVFRYDPQRERADSNLSNVTQIYTI